MSPRRAFKLAALRFPHLRLQQPRHVQHPSLMSAEQHRRPSEASEAANSFLVETRRNRDIDAGIRIEIELRFRESIVNRTYVFPRQLSPHDTESRTIPSRKHTTAKSYDANSISPLRPRLVPETQQAIRLSSRDQSLSASKAVRLRTTLKPKRLATVTQVSRSKSPYVITSVSPLRTASRSASRQQRDSGRLRPQQSLRALRQRGPSPYNKQSSRSTDRLATLQ
jgi:hypothetical protein